jgi:hypothetical protein
VFRALQDALQWLERTRIDRGPSGLPENAAGGYERSRRHSRWRDCLGATDQ